MENGMTIFDFRLRPPYKSFTRLGIYNPPCNMVRPQKHHAIPSRAAEEKSMDLFLQEMHEAGITAGVVMGRQVANDMASASNDDIRELASAYPDTFIPFASINTGLGVSGMMKELEQCLHSGFRGIAMEPTYSLPPHKADDNVLYPVYARCEQAGVPVVLTLSFFQGDLDYSFPVAVQHVAKDFPDLQIVLAHACYPWIPMVFNLCLKCPNIWLLPDIYMFNPDAPGNAMYGEAMRWLDGERILFGSAYPCYNMKQAINDIDRFHFSTEHKEKFFYKNAYKLLNIHS